jgi:hypothetical protein
MDSVRLVKKDFTSSFLKTITSTVIRMAKFKTRCQKSGHMDWPPSEAHTIPAVMSMAKLHEPIVARSL